MTPYYLDDGDAEGFHRFYKDICDRYDSKVRFIVTEVVGFFWCSCSALFMLAFLARGWS